MAHAVVATLRSGLKERRRPCLEYADSWIAGRVYHRPADIRLSAFGQGSPSSGPMFYMPPPGRPQFEPAALMAASSQAHGSGARGPARPHAFFRILDSS